VAILSDSLEACQHFFKVCPKFSLKRLKPRLTRSPRLRRTGFADLKLAPFPTRSPLPFAALPSISLFPSARFTDESEVRHQPSIGGNSGFSRKRNNAVTFWHTLSTGQVRPAGGDAKNVKEKMIIRALACSRQFFGPRNTRMIRNEPSVAGGSETSSTDRRPFFLISSRFAACRRGGVSWGPNALASPGASCESRGKPIQLL